MESITYSKMVTLSTLTVGDVLTGNFLSGCRKIDIDAILPFFIVPLLLITATMSFVVTIIVMVVIVMGSLYVMSRPRQKNRSPFFFSWILASGITMYFVYQCHVGCTFLITITENLIFTSLVVLTSYCFYKMKTVATYELTGASKGKEYSPVLTSDSKYCQICQIEVNERFFHSIWWDCCIFTPNYCYYLGGQMLALITLLFGADLALTVICRPFIFYGNILLPERCERTLIYEEYKTAIILVTSIYALGYVFIIVLVLLHQVCTDLRKYLDLKWRKYYSSVLSV